MLTIVSEIMPSLNFTCIEFQSKFHFQKPSRDQTLVVYCRSGRRSGKAFEILKDSGYIHVLDYSGSWNEWSLHASKDE